MAFEVHGWPDRMCHMPSRRGRFHGLMNVKRNWQLRAASINVLQAALCRMVAVNFVPNSCSLTTHLDRSRIPLASSSSSRAVACTEAEILTRSVRTCMCVCMCVWQIFVSIRARESFADRGLERIASKTLIWISQSAGKCPFPRQKYL